MIPVSEDSLYKVFYKDSGNFYNMFFWLEKNCQGTFYVIPEWVGTYVQFENEQDAILFSLTWS